MLNILFYYIFICILYVYVYISGHLGCRRHQQVAANTWDQNWGSLWFTLFACGNGNLLASSTLASSLIRNMDTYSSEWLPAKQPESLSIFWLLVEPPLEQYARQWESSAQMWLRINVHETTTNQLVSLTSSWVLLDQLGTGGHMESDFRMDPREAQHL